MKHPFPIANLPSPIAESHSSRERRPLSCIPHSALRNPHSERGVALVITLVLLSIITFMAVTFLVVSRSQHGSVATATDQAIARLAADTARERAIAELMAPMLAFTNELNYGLLVSTNYINPSGFFSGVSGPLNVSYNYSNGAPLNPNDSLLNSANLLYDPRPPVFIVTNAFGSNDFRFYVDLNRNRRYDPSGPQPVIGADGLPVRNPNGGGVISNWFIGDPEWIGALQHPEFAHAADNKFVTRYVYLALPAGETLDINRIHNQALRPAKTKLDPSGPDFLRNQGVGTFEINLAAFLHDLNTNLYAWGGQYRYDPLGGSPAGGNAFADAGALLAYRYAMNPVNNAFTLASVSQLLGLAGVNAFGRDFLDGYSGGPVMTGTSWPQAAQPDSDSSRVTTSWAGADNANHFYTTQDLFDKNKTGLGVGKGSYSFTDRLLAVGTNNSSYDRYTFYRLLSQLGTDSAPEPGGKMNLNYCNVDANGYVVPNMATNFIPWIPVQFFTNAAIRLLADAGYAVGAASSTSNLLVVHTTTNASGFSITTTNLQIPVWPTNLYTPSVHRALQLAANIYDATTNRTFNIPTASNGFPTVFRPVFANGGSGKLAGQVSIIGYEEATNASVLAQGMVDLADPNSRQTLKAIDNQHMVYNIPLVIGAKKGLPNFNELAMQTLVQVIRKLQFSRLNGPDSPISQTNQMFLVCISNVFGVEAWNSYAANFSRPLLLYVWPDISIVLTNETGKVLNPTSQRYQPPLTLTNIGAWAGYNRAFETYSFQIPFYTNLLFLTNSSYRYASAQFMPASGVFEKVSPAFFIPHWWLTVKTRLRFAVVDTSTSPTRIVDYVNLSDQNQVSLTDMLMQGGQCGNSYLPDGAYGSLWCTNHYPAVADPNLPTFGVLNQIQIGLGQQPAYGQAVWNSAMNSFPAGMDKTAAIDSFRNQFGLGQLFSHPVGTVFYPSNTFASPFQPVRNIYLITSWQANDPLVHYTVGDLTSLTRTNLVLDNLPTPAPIAGLKHVNLRYEPWGGNPASGSSSKTAFDLKVKDPLMLQSDSWDFPTNKLPNVGWLGRVHRGTPWQTVYLKSPATDLPNWGIWTGNGQIVTNVGQIDTNLLPLYVRGTATGLANDAIFTHPTNDWRLADLFTTALSENATRGQMSINQPNLAAWSAVLSGVIALTNNLDASGSPIVDANGNPIPVGVPIQPAGVYDPSDPTTWSPVVQLWKRINDVRFTNSTRHVFSRLGDLLAVPELSVASPFLNTNGTATLRNSGLNDAAYERVPQQILGLLKCDHTPRFVIYAFGQTLKPAPHAIVPSGPFSGLCTNYQIVAEAATRTVVRLEGVQPSLPGKLPPPITTLHPVIESFNVLPPD
jgi:hypothetical protein